MNFVSRTLEWVRSHERMLGLLFFLFGFVTDLFTFTLLSVSAIALFFLAYASLALVSILGLHVVLRFAQIETWSYRTFTAILPLVTQYAFGGIFSGFMIFYTHNATIAVSWPFLAIILLIYIGNEYFRLQRAHLVYQMVMFFFALYGILIFALPLLVGSIGPLLFIGSTVSTIAIFILFLWLLYVIEPNRIKRYLKDIGIWTVGTTFLIVVSYFGGTIPPIPLALSEAEVYHNVVRTSAGYTTIGEQKKEWWNMFNTQEAHVTPGSPLYAYTSVTSPITFSTRIVHVWEQKTENGWMQRSRITFTIHGGRQQGYRGYSEKTVIEPGLWRVSIQTENGQVLGRLKFEVVEVSTPPILYTNYK